MNNKHMLFFHSNEFNLAKKCIFSEKNGQRTKRALDHFPPFGVSKISLLSLVKSEKPSDFIDSGLVESWKKMRHDIRRGSMGNNDNEKGRAEARNNGAKSDADNGRGKGKRLSERRGLCGPSGGTINYRRHVST